MTFPTIPTVAAGRVLTGVQANTTATRTFPNLSGLTKNAGDRLIAICIAYQTSTGTNAAFSGWTGGFSEIHDSATSTTMAIGVAEKVSDGTETGTIVVTQAGTITGHACFFLLSIPGAHASTPSEVGGRASGTSAAAAIGALNPAGWDVEDTLWIAVGGSGEVSTTGSYTGMTTGDISPYTDAVVTGASGDVAGAVEGKVMFRQVAAASEDPPNFAPDLSNARNAGVIIAVRPAAAAAQSITGSTPAVSVTAVSGAFAGEASIIGSSSSVAVAAATGGVFYDSWEWTVSTKEGGAASEYAEPFAVHQAQAAVIVGTSASVTVIAASQAFTPGAAMIVGTIASVTVVAASGSILSVTTLSGTAAGVLVTGATQALSPGQSALTGQTATVTVIAASQALMPGAVSLVGSTATVSVVAASQAIVGGPASIPQTIAGVRVLASSGLIFGGNTLVGSSAAVRVTAASGVITGVGTVAVVGSTPTVRVSAQSQAFAPGAVTIPATTASVRVSAAPGAIAPAGTALAGTTAGARVTVSSGAFTPGPAALIGAAVAIRVLTTSSAFTPGDASIPQTVALIQIVADSIGFATGGIPFGPLSWRELTSGRDGREVGRLGRFGRVVDRVRSGRELR